MHDDNTTLPAFPKGSDGAQRRKRADDLHGNRHLVTFRDAEESLVTSAADHLGMPLAVFLRNSAIVAARKALEDK
jgi:hypothetical protein